MGVAKYIEEFVPGVKYNGLNTGLAVDFSNASSVALPAGTTIAGVTAAGATTITSTSATSLAVGPSGTSNPILNVDSSTGSAVAGISIVGATSAGTVTATVTSSGSNASLTVDAKGSGTLGVNSASTTAGLVTIGNSTSLAGATVNGPLTAVGALKSTPQLLTGAGAVNLLTLVTEIVSTGADAGTLADGTNGQIKIIVMKTDGGDHTLTPTTKTGYTTIVFNDAGDGVGLVFVTTVGWLCFANFGCTIS